MYQRILVPVDASATASQGIEAAIDIARLTGGSIRLLHVLDMPMFATGFEVGGTYWRDVLPRMQRHAVRLLEKAQARVAAAGVRADWIVSECLARRTADVILDAAKEWNAELIVLGTHGRRGASRLFLGSDAEQVLRGATVPVLLVRSVDGRDDEAIDKTRAAARASA